MLRRSSFQRCRWVAVGIFAHKSIPPSRSARGVGLDGCTPEVYTHTHTLDLALQNFRNINCLVIFSIFGGVGPRNVNDLTTSPINQFRDHSHRNRIEKLVPLNYRFPTDNKKNITKIDQTVFKLDVWQKYGFPKIRDLSPVAPRWFILPEMTTPKKSGNARKHKKKPSLFDKIVAFVVLSFFPPPPFRFPPPSHQAVNPS